VDKSGREGRLKAISAGQRIPEGGIPGRGKKELPWFWGVKHLKLMALRGLNWLTGIGS
jgi:hypothetical protein